MKTFHLFLQKRSLIYSWKIGCNLNVASYKGGENLTLFVSPFEMGLLCLFLLANDEKACNNIWRENQLETLQQCTVRIIRNNETDRVFQKFSLPNISSIISIIFAMNSQMDGCDEVEFKKLYHEVTQLIHCKNISIKIILTDFNIRKTQICITE